MSDFMVLPYHSDDHPNTHVFLPFYSNMKRPTIFDDKIAEISEKVKISNGEILLPMLPENIKLSTILDYFNMGMVPIKLYAVYEYDKFMCYRIVVDRTKNLWLMSHECDDINSITRFL